MSAVNLVKLDGSQAEFRIADIESALSGEILYPKTAPYDRARSIWNAMIDRRPGLIVRPQEDADVIALVEFARQHELLIAIKAGGHNIAGKGLVDGGLVLDFGSMKRVSVDSERKLARVQPGATLADVDRATQAYGLLVPTGVNSTTGISGLTLGGGFGWTTRKYGLTIDNLRSARLVTADGKILNVDAEEHPDLFWAVRGGGGNFGVVCEFEFNLSDGGPEVLAGMVVHPLDDMKTVITEYQKALEEAPDEMTCWAVLRRAPPLPFLPEEWHGKAVAVLAMCCLGEISEAELSAAPFRAIGKPIADVVGPMSFVDWQAAFDPLLTLGARNYWKSHDVASLRSDALEVIAAAVRELPTDECEVFFGHVGGAMTRHRSDSTAWPNRDAHFAVNIHTRWRDASDDDRCRDWARNLHAKLEPHAMGSIYVNFIPEGDEDRLEAAYGSNLEKLRRVKGAVDPDNFFRANQNIAPRLLGSRAGPT